MLPGLREAAAEGASSSPRPYLFRAPWAGRPTPYSIAASFLDALCMCGRKCLGIGRRNDLLRCHWSFSSIVNCLPACLPVCWSVYLLCLLVDLFACFADECLKSGPADGQRSIGGLCRFPAAAFRSASSGGAVTRVSSTGSAAGKRRSAGYRSPKRTASKAGDLRRHGIRAHLTGMVAPAQGDRSGRSRAGQASPGPFFDSFRGQGCAGWVVQGDAPSRGGGLQTVRLALE